MKPKVLFVAGNISSFDATPIKIYDYLKATSHLVDKPKLVALLDLKSFLDSKKKKEVKEIFQKAGIPLIYILRFLPISLLCILYIYTVGRYNKLYANNLTAGINVLFLKKLLGIKYVFDFHGSIPEERVLIGFWKNNSFKYRISKILERKIALNSQANVAISNAALKYLKVDNKDKFNLVIPCGINFDPKAVTHEIRNKLRSDLNIKNKFVVIYSGSLSPWNDYDIMKYAIQAIRKATSEFYFLILSKEEESTIEEFIKGMSIEKNEYLHLNLSHTEVQNYTSCADLALLLRKDSIVNKISSPMKFGEYIGAGVPVLISSNIGDASFEVNDNELGYVFDETMEYTSIQKFINKVVLDRSSFFQRNKDFAYHNYKLSSVIEKYKILYNA